MTKKAFVAIVTCFNDDETINYEATRAQVRRQVAAGNNIMCAGTNGDFSALTHGEKVKLLEEVVDEVGGKVDVIVNAGMPATFETLQLAKEFDRIGVTGIAVITPFFIACAQDGLIRHFSTVADAVNTPVYLYDIPARTQNHIEPETARKLATHGNIAGIKDSGGAQETWLPIFRSPRKSKVSKSIPVPTTWSCGRCRMVLPAAFPVSGTPCRTSWPASSVASTRAISQKPNVSRKSTPPSAQTSTPTVSRRPWSSARFTCRIPLSAPAASRRCLPIANRTRRLLKS